MAHRNARLTPVTRLELASGRWRPAGPRRSASPGASGSLVPPSLTEVRGARRFREAGADGLEDRSSAPHRQPRRTTPELERRICAVRRSAGFGPHRIAWALGLARSTVYAVLRALRCSTASTACRPREQASTLRYEHPAPGDLLHLDVKKLGRMLPRAADTACTAAPRATPRTRGLDYLHVAVDDHSRYAYVAVLPDERGA